MELTRVVISDVDASYLDLLLWASKNCSSYASSTFTDVSDVTMFEDIIYEFWFKDAKDATMFRLK